MTKAVYVLEIVWLWDNFNTEYATITVEEPETGFEDILRPNCPHKSMLLRRLEKAKNGMDRSILGENKMVRLYRIEWKGKYKKYKWPILSGDRKTNAVNLKMRMIPICDFDEKGRPIPVEIDHLLRASR